MDETSHIWGSLHLAKAPGVLGATSSKFAPAFRKEMFSGLICRDEKKTRGTPPANKFTPAYIRKNEDHQPGAEGWRAREVKLDGHRRPHLTSAYRGKSGPKFGGMYSSAPDPLRT